MRTKVKICGITRLEDALWATKVGADAIGFVFTQSPRRIEVERAKVIIRELPPFICKTGVFVDESARLVWNIANCVGLDTLQFHGSESPEYCKSFHPFKVIKAFKVSGEGEYLRETLREYKGQADAFLFDAYVPGVAGGTGQKFSWELLLGIEEYGPFILAGGLSEQNVCEAINLLQPYGVDVSSGVESQDKGIKDRDKVLNFISKVRRCEYVS